MKCPGMIKEAFPKMILPIVAGVGVLGYIGARKLTEPDREKLKEEVKKELSNIPLINPKHSTVKVKPGIFNPTTKKVEIDLRVKPSESVLSKSKSMFGQGTADFHIPGRLLNKKIEIDSIYLKDKYKRKGIGKSFLDLIDNIARKRNIPNVSVIADDEGRYFWSRVKGMEATKQDMGNLKQNYKIWCQKNNKKSAEKITSIKDFPKEFLLSDDATDGAIWGFVSMNKKIEKTAQLKCPGMIKEAMNSRDPVSLKDSFIAGIDPTGSKTFRLSQKATRHKKHRAVGLAGGLIGGTVLIPSTVSGIIGGIKGFAKGRGAVGRMIGGLKGFGKGAILPYSTLHHGIKGTRALGKARKTGLLSRKGSSHIEKALGLEAGGKLIKSKSFRNMLPQLRGTKGMTEAHRLVKDKTINAASALGASALLGGSSSILQYNLGKRVGDERRRGWAKS